MNANIMMKKIELSTKEAKAAGKVGSPEYEELNTLMNRFPTFEISVVKTKSNSGHFIRMTTADMKSYIEKHDDDHSIMKTFNSLRGLDENEKKIPFAAVASIGELKVWFLETFPEIEEFGKNNTDILNKAREARKARKAA